MRTLIPLSLLLVTTTLVTTPILQAQDMEEVPVPFVYVSEYQVPWDRVDSLTTLLQAYPEWVAKAREMGHVLDYQTWIHLYGDEWNVVIVRTFPSQEAWNNQESGWLQSVNRMVEPDSARRAANSEGFAWVYDGVPHRDNLYRALGLTP